MANSSRIETLEILEALLATSECPLVGDCDRCGCANALMELSERPLLEVATSLLDSFVNGNPIVGAVSLMSRLLATGMILERRRAAIRNRRETTVH